jgi:hypothetical protein
VSPQEVREPRPSARARLTQSVRPATDQTEHADPNAAGGQGAASETPVRPDGIEGLECAIENASTDWWFAGALLAIKQLAISGRGFTADHLLDMVGAPSDPHYLGAVFAAAQRQHVIEPVGARVGRDGRLVRVWWGIPA